MPQMDLYIGMSQVFWFTVIFITFYLLIVQNILPVIARSVKLRKQKLVLLVYRLLMMRL